MEWVEVTAMAKKKEITTLYIPAPDGVQLHEQGRDERTAFSHVMHYHLRKRLDSKRVAMWDKYGCIIAYRPA